MSCRGPTPTLPKEADLPEVGAGEAEVVVEAGAGTLGQANPNVGAARIRVTPTHLDKGNQLSVTPTPLALPTLG